MIRLIARELIHNARIWVGTFAVSLVAGFVGAFAASLIDTSLRYDGEVRQFLAGGSMAMLIFTSITAVIVLSSISNLTVALQRRSYALWQLVGVPPSRVGSTVVAQLLIVTALGSASGVLLARSVLNPAFTLIFSSWSAITRVNFTLSLIAASYVVAGVVAVMLLGGLRGARRASRIAPIVALREPDAVAMKVRWFRMLLAAAVLGGLCWAAASLYGAEFTVILNTSIVITPLIVALIAVLGPLVLPAVQRAWTFLVPRRASASWFLARHSAGYRLSQSAAAISPLMVAIGLTGGLYTTSALLRQSLIERTGDDNGWSLPLESVVVMLGGPLLLSAVAAAATVYMTSHAREHEFALALAAGATQRTVIAMAVWEAVIYASSAFLLGLAAIVGGGIIVATALELRSMPLSWASAAIIAGGGLVLLLAATVVPTIASLRHSVARTLAAE
ncbi:FtsX-like permease family protein [Paramicrobacterium fandaimingii]|uniref:FtsX-like permease family protein n=1 Tax=Paramicrobacterium fandaimingii TaxID=2708079 RepID=UPI0014245A08|nr:ABC transporter permease [Microbacterium fandaimingii]